MRRFSPKELEPKWQKKWQDSDIYKAKDFDKKPKFVMLTEFPYPSGDGLHLGHIREYTYGDIISRRKRMQGFNVLYPMGWDAFGLPTENYAIKMGIAPQIVTENNVATFKKQMQMMGLSFDWDREINTSDPNYYKWTQWLFLQFYKAGLAYQDEIDINWCPFCKTGLANEEVVNGRHERCDTLVEKKTLKQWLLKITAYADRLIEGLKTVDYPSRIADQQINWIGKSQGAEIDFKVEDSDKTIKVFTTRPDTLFGATFMVLAPEHPIIQEIVADDHKSHVNAYIKSAASKSDVERQNINRDKSGVATGAYAVNPINQEKIPVFTADYVLMGYGTGAIMAVPAHDERDYEFANAHNLPIKRVIKNKAGDEEHTDQPGEMMNSGEYNGLKNKEAGEKIVAELEKQGIAKPTINYRLRDWIFSRQHYWGEPIPIIHCEKHGAVAVPEDQLPVTLPEVKNYEPSDDGQSPLAKVDEWVNTTCPECGDAAKRETDTMPNWAGSSWYYLRYYDPKNDKEFASKEKLKYWEDVDLYLGGMEHTTLHLLYSRFWHQFFYDQKLVPTPEPYAARRGQGIILAADGSKMSKSKGNVVNPTEIIESGYGADAVRLAIAFLAPYDQTTPWSPEGVAGTHRFLQRLWTLTQEYVASEKGTSSSPALLKVANQLIQKVDSDLEKMNFNTAIAAMMEALNQLYKVKAEDSFKSKEWAETLNIFIRLIAPYAPHTAEELWQELGNKESVHAANWPKADNKYLTIDSVVIVVQVNGKLRGQIECPFDTSEEESVKEALKQEKVAAHIDGKDIKKTIFVKNKLINFVV